MADVHVSVVCTNNRPALEGCLETIPAACGELDWRVTVVDNASTDGTSEMVRERFPWAQVVRNDVRRGFSANHNITALPVVAAASARYVLILNDDTRFDPGAVAAMVAFADARPQVGAVGPAIRGLDGAPQQSLFGFPTAWHLVRRHLRPARTAASLPGPRGGWLNGSCVLLRTAALARTGPLDTRFFIFFEDTDIGLRLLEHGLASVIDPDAGMIHLEHQTVAQPQFGSVMAKQMLRSQWLYLRKHEGRPVAALASAGTRAVLGVRLVKAALLRSREPDGTPLAPLLLSLIRYSPADPLPHEQAAASPIPSHPSTARAA